MTIQREGEAYERLIESKMQIYDRLLSRNMMRRDHWGKSVMYKTSGLHSENITDFMYDSIP